MIKCEFSETQFSFCFTFEYIRDLFPVPLPLFPNTVAEGRVGGGYDVQIAQNVFFQFKIPSYHNTPNNYHRKYWNVFHQPYYKLKIDADSTQFKLLKELADQSVLNNVFYSAPGFFTRADLEKYYGNQEIVWNSVQFSVRGMPNHGTGIHRLIYSPDFPMARVFSDSVPITKYGGGDLWGIAGTTKAADETIFSVANEIRKVILRNADGLDIGALVVDSDPASLVEKIHRFLVVYFDVYWYPVLPFQPG